MKHLNTLCGGLLLASLFTLSCGRFDFNSNTDQEDEHLAYRQGDHGFAGTVEGTEALIAIVIGLEVAEVLVVDGDDKIYERFEVELPEDYALSFENAVGAGISAKYENDTYAGEVTLSNGEKHSFTAKVIEGDVAGMFFILDEGCDRGKAEGGWIVDGASTQRGAMRVQSTFVDTPVLDSNTVSHDGTDYPVYKAAPPPKGGGGGMTVGFPDVCKTPTPAGPVNIPYPG